MPAQASFGSATFDGVFNLTGMTSTVASPSNFSGSTTWSYDSKDSLTNETSTRFTGWNHANFFDGAFNPTTFKNQTRTYNQDNQLTGSGMTYDGNGNPTSYNGATLAFDVENRVTNVGLSGGLTCGYRSDGLRAWKQDNQGVRTYFLYDGGNPILELDSGGAVKNVNVFAPDGLVARKEGANWTYYTFDPQGNVLNKLDASEGVTAGRLLDAWGQGVETTLPRNIDPWGYNAKWGYYYDRETALYLCQHRMYDASAGRWLNRDPIGLAGGMNLYGYCAGGPVGAVDPWGLWTIGGFEFTGETVLGGLETSGAMLVSALSDMGAESLNVSASAVSPSIQLLRLAGMDLGAHGWDGGSLADAPGSAESKVAWSIAISALSMRCELVTRLRVPTTNPSGGYHGSAGPVENHHPFPRAEASKILREQPELKGHPAFSETQPVPQQIHRGRGGLHGQGYNGYVRSLIDERGGYAEITGGSISDIMDHLREIGLR